jgi:hypothetical protein
MNGEIVCHFEFPLNLSVNLTGATFSISELTRTQPLRIHDYYPFAVKNILMPHQIKKSAQYARLGI